MGQQHSPKSPWHSPPLWTGEHSTVVEHRLTLLESSETSQQTTNKSVKSRLYWHERALQTIAAVLYFLVNGKAHTDWAPSFAELLIKLMKMGP